MTSHTGYRVLDRLTGITWGPWAEVSPASRKADELDDLDMSTSPGEEGVNHG